MAGVILQKRVYKLNDSKLLSEAQRERLYARIVAASIYHIVTFDAQTIDNDGISTCLHNGLKAIKEALAPARFLFDGNSSFGVSGIETMVGADGKVKEVSAASIVAKVTRDRIMCELSARYPEYGFEKHKGYGTKAHIDAIKHYGRCEIHRRSYRIKEIDTPALF